MKMNTFSAGYDRHQPVFELRSPKKM